MTNETNTQAAPNNNSVKRFEENAVNQVLAKVNDFSNNGNLQLPPRYSAENALRSAWLVIQQTVNLDKRPALDVCTKESIANALFDMVLKGLSPAKKQCYFIVYGNKLQMQQSYFGTISIAKRVAGVKDAVGVPVYEKDVFKYTIDIKTGIKTVTEHQQDFENIDPAKIKGAYAIITYEDGSVEYEIMTWNQIWQSWQMGATKGNSPAHKNFPDQMACRTVINRALKIPVNTSNDDDLFGGLEESTYSKQVEADVKHTIENNSNGAACNGAIGFEDDTHDTSYTEESSDNNEGADETANENAGDENNNNANEQAPPAAADLFNQQAVSNKTNKAERKKHF
jgi:recombination protein RecT